MTDKDKEVKRAKKESQSAFESRVARESRAVLLATERKANKKYAGGVDLANLKDAKAINPAGEGGETEETKKAKTSKGGK